MGAHIIFLKALSCGKADARVVEPVFGGQRVVMLVVIAGEVFLERLFIWKAFEHAKRVMDINMVVF